MTCSHDVARAIAETTSLAARGCLVSLTIGGWTGRQRDNRVAAAGAAAYGADQASCDSIISLVPKDRLRRVQRAQTALRSAHYRLTVGWVERATRYLPASAAATYTNVMRALQLEEREAVADLAAELPDLFAQASERLGGLYRDGLLPSVQEVEQSYYSTIAFAPVPQHVPGLVAPDEVAREISASIDAAISEAETAVRKDLISRLLAAVEPLERQLSEGGTKLFVATIRNAQEVLLLARSLGSLDPRIERCVIALGSIQGDPEAIKSSESLRAASAAAASEALAALTAPAPAAAPAPAPALAAWPVVPAKLPTPRRPADWSATLRALRQRAREVTRKEES